MTFTKQQVKDFADNPVWIDIKQTLEARLEEYRLELEKNLNWDETQRVRASINQLRFFMVQPELMLMELQTDEDMKKE